MVSVETATVADLLKQYRATAGLTQEELAERAGLSARAISDLERGIRSHPHPHTVHRLVQALGLTEDEVSRFQAAARRPQASGGVRAEPTGNFLGALPVGPIVARDDELERVAAVAGTVRAGAGRLLLIAGEAGVGKTRLAQEVVLQLRDEGFLVLTGRCYERERGTTFSPFFEVMTQLYATLSPAARSEAARRWPPVTRFLSGDFAATDENEAALIRAVTGLLSDIAAERPLAVVLDDLHCADDASLALLHHLARETRSSRVLLLGTFRDTEVEKEHPLGQTVRELDREGLVERLAVRRLAEEGTAALVAATIGEAEGGEDFAEFVHRRTKGNPFYIQKMLQALGGHYRLIRQIGAGGMGRVFAAEDTRTGQIVAAKIMFARTEADPRALQRFEQEGAILATLDHPHIVRVHEAIVEEHSGCIVMELLAGRSLGQILRSERLELGRLKRLATQVAAALQGAHERGIVHRDIKPDNIMVVGEDRVKVTDFGIARMLRPIDAVTTMTSTGMTMGTPLYMAPEQIEGKKVDGRTDIYALGAVLYEAVTGRPPFVGEDPLAVAISHVREAPRPPREINPAVPRDWEALILKTLAKQPADRFPTAVALDRALAGLSEGKTGLESAGADRPAAARLAPLLAVATALVLLVAILAYRAVSASGASHATLGTLVASWQLPPASPALLRKPAAVAVDRQGMFYVLDAAGGRVERISPSGTLLDSFGSQGSAPGQLRDPQALALDVQDNVYVADSGNDRVEKFSPGGHVLAVWGTTGSGLGQFRFPDGIAVDRRGYIYVSDWGNNRIEVLDRSGHPQTTSAGTFTALYSGLNHPTGLAVDAKGEVYVADTGDNQITEFGPDGVITLASWSGEGDPTGVALDNHGNVYVTDAQRSDVQLFAPSGALVRSWYLGAGGVGHFKAPLGIAADGQGTAYLADTGNARILKLTAGGWRPAWKSGAGQAPDPESLAVDADGTAYIADVANNRILKRSPTGRWLAAWRVDTSRRFPFVGPIGGLALDQHADVYVTDYGGGQVLKISSTGRILHAWGASGSGPRLTNPQGVAVDSRGNVYVVDQGNSRVQVFSPSGTLRRVWRIASSTAGSANEPYLYGIAVDHAGSVFVTDDLSDRIIQLSAQGQVTAQWGATGSKPGQLRAPEGLTADDRTGVIYVADTGNNRIAMFSVTGKSLGATGAHLLRPTDVVLDGRGHLYIADAGKRQVSEFMP